MTLTLNIQEIKSRHRHELRKVKPLMPALCRINQGRKIIEWEDSTEVAEKNSLIVFPAWQELYIENIPVNESYFAEILYIPLHVLEAFEHSYPNTTKPPRPKLCIAASNETNFCWDQLKYAISKNYSAQLVEHMLLSLLLTIKDTDATTLLLGAPKLPLIDRCYSIISLSPAKHWTAQDIAAKLSMSKSTLYRGLSSEGIGFQQLLDDIRLSNALHDLQTTTIAVSEVAQRSGYACPSRFTERFKKRFGITPRDLRKSIKGHH